MKRGIAGLAAIGLYLVASYVLGHVDVRARKPLLDGAAPNQPYNYVSPPPDLRESNVAPTGLDERYPLKDEKNALGLTFATPDGQAQLFLQSDAIPRPEGEKAVDFEISPLDPADFRQPGEGLVVDGNVYRFEATYTESNEPVEITQTGTLILRYPVQAEVIVQLEGDAWRRLDTEAAQASLQLFADSEELGTFAAAGPPHGGRGRWWVPALAAAAGLGAAFAGYWSGRRRTTARTARRSRPRRRPS